MSDLRAEVLRVAATLPVGSPLRRTLLITLKQAAEFTLYKDYLAWNEELYAKGDYSHPGMNLRMNWMKAEHSSEKTFAVLENLYYKSTTTDAKLHAWASRIKDPNVAVSLAYTAWKLQNGRLNQFDSPYFFQNWKGGAARFQAFGALVEKACSARFWEIAGRDARVKPEAPPTAKDTFTPPAVPTDLIPTTASDWELYSSSPGAGQAARALASATATIVGMVGRNVTPYNKDDKNAAAIQAVRSRMNKVFSTYADWGATDGEPESVFRSVLRKYVTLYLDKWTFPKTYDALSRFG